MSESDKSSFRKITETLKLRLSKEPLKSEVMLPHELKALKMAEDLRRRMSRTFPRSHTHNYIPIQWAVRTSMDDIRNASVLDDAIQEIGREGREEVARISGSSAEDLEIRFKRKGDLLDSESFHSAYTIVDINIDHKNISDPGNQAKRFFSLLEKVLSKHKPNYSELSLDQLSSLSKGIPPENDTGARFETKYFFTSKPK